MTEREYRQDDTSDGCDGYCPTCGDPLSGLTVAGRGYCDRHGWTWAEWTAPNRDENDPATGRCARCGHWWDEHPSGWCPDQLHPDGSVTVATVQAFEPREIPLSGTDDDERNDAT